MYDYMYDEGLAILFQSKSTIAYKEKLKLELTNLKCAQTEFLIDLKPMQSILIRTTVINSDKPISYSQDYLVIT